MRPVERVEAESQNESGEGLKKKPQLYLFTTRTCPNCRTAKEFLKGVDYQIIDARSIRSWQRSLDHAGPTLVLVRDGVVQKFANASNIRRFAEEVKA